METLFIRQAGSRPQACAPDSSQIQNPPATAQSLAECPSLPEPPGRGRRLTEGILLWAGEARSKYTGLHYDRLVGALGRRSLPPLVHGAHAGPVCTGAMGGEPCDWERSCMDLLGISYEAGVYGVGEFHCDSLQDAVTYAYLRRHTDGLGLSW